MDPSSAEQEINRIERELDAKNPPPGKPPVRRGQSAVSGDGSEKNQSMDAVLIGVVLLLGIGATFALGEWLTTTQKTHQRWRCRCCCWSRCWVWRWQV